MAVIKADAYGHDMGVAAECLHSAEEFAVSSLDDVARLRSLGIVKVITLLSASFDSDDLNSLITQNVRPSLYDYSQLALFENLPDNADLSIWLKVDTGMGRLGLSMEEIPGVLKRLSAVKGIRDISLMTHLPNADQFDHPSSQQQFDLFNILASEYSFKELSILNSAGVVNFSQNAQDIVRPGAMLYGFSPVAGTTADDLDLLPAMTFKSKLISVKHLPSGSTIGYGSSYVLTQDSKIGVVACGYGDGYPRHAKSGTPVSINGLLVPLIGRVSMDMITVDLTEADGQIAAKVGDDVILWGEENPIEVVAEYAGTIAYELCCGILPRVERLYS